MHRNKIELFSQGAERRISNAVDIARAVAFLRKHGLEALAVAVEDNAELLAFYRCHRDRWTQ